MATKKAGGDDYTLATCERVRIEKGQQYFEVEIVGDEVNSLLVGVVSAGIGTEERSGKNFAFSGEKRAWLMYMYSGSLYGNGKQVSDYAGPLRKGDRLGTLRVTAPGFETVERPLIAGADVGALGPVGRVLSVAQHWLGRVLP